MIVVQKQSLKGSITVPGDRSISHRAVIFSSLSKGTAEISGYSMTEDCLSTIDCFRKMGIGIDILRENRIRVNGKGLNGLKQPLSILNAGISGTTIRLLLGVLVGQPFTTSITRDDSEIRKPVGKLIEVLRLMGANIIVRENGNVYPLTVQPANLKGLTYEITPEDAYIKSPMLIAALYSTGETIVIEKSKSRDHTELMLSYLGADIDFRDGSVKCRKSSDLYSKNLTIPGDISIASYFFTAGIIVPDSRITVANTGINRTRTSIIDIYKSMGANISIGNVHVENNEPIGDISAESSGLKGTIVEADIIPFIIDEIPALIVAAATAEGITEIRGIWDCKLKEMTRVRTIADELRKMGANIRDTVSGLLIEGVRHLKGTIVDSRNDHIIAMALAIAGLVAEGETMVKRAQILDAAYPDFMAVLNRL